MFDDLFRRYPVLKECEDSINAAYNLMVSTYTEEGKILICGNGGSCADAEHMVGELMKSFLCERPLETELNDVIMDNYRDYKDLLDLQTPLPAIALNEHCALSTAVLNDMNPDLLFAQQLLGLANPEKDLLIGISTSGNAKNVQNAFKLSKVLCMKSILLTGNDGGKCRALSTISICVPESETYKIQELHLPIYHALCASCEKEFFGGEL